MKLSYNGKTYECVSVEKKPREIVIHTGIETDGEEVIYHILGDIDFDAVQLEGGTWSAETGTLTLEDRVNALERMNTPAAFESGKWYYRGDKMTFESFIYTCIAPEGVVCVWSPTDYPQYWEKGVQIA